MINACEQTNAVALQKGIDHRTAALYNALHKIALVYEGSGMLFMR